MADVRARFLNVVFIDMDMEQDTIKPLFDKALDWIKYAPNCWILWSNRDPKQWYGFIKPYLTGDGGVLIAEIDLTESGAKYAGFMTKMFWDWIHKHQS
jgi:hypothetical protein